MGTSFNREAGLRLAALLFLRSGKFGELGKTCFDHDIAILPVRFKAAAAVFNAVWKINEIPAAPAAQRIERAVAKEAVEALGVLRFMAREIRALGVGKKDRVVFFRCWVVSLVVHSASMAFVWSGMG